VLVHWDVDAGYTCHCFTTSTLALLVARIGAADDEHDTAAPHDLAVLADFLD
jgi:hypothetical protein